MKTPSGSISIEVDKHIALADEPLKISLTGLRQDQRITIKAACEDDRGVSWSSQATYAADEKGIIDMAKERPLSGSYEQVDVMGLFWSMKPDTGKEAPSNFRKENLEPVRIRLTLESGGTTIDSLELQRIYLDPGVTVETLDQEGLVGRFFLPPPTQARPCVIVLGGSDGSLQEDIAAILASRGYASLALAFFKARGLPDELVEVPLETIERAIAWLQDRDEVDGDRLAVMGRSKGAELAVLAGATLSQLKAVISVCGSGLVWQGISADPRSREVKSSWTWRGKPFPFLPMKMGFTTIVKMIWSDKSGKPASPLSMYEGGLKDREAVDNAAIPVEKINGPVIFISGGQDKVWPSGRMAEMALHRLAFHNHPFKYKHLHYKGAGHGIGLPFRPTTIHQSVRPDGSILDFGGEAHHDALACGDSWPRALKMLGERLRPS